jgi:hypothetical protein
MHLTTSKSGNKSTGAEIAKDFLGRGRDKNRITQTQKQSLLVLSPHVLFVSRYSMSLCCCLDTRRDTERKYFEVKKQNTHTHTHKTKRKQRETDCREINRPSGLTANSIESLEGITFR